MRIVVDGLGNAFITKKILDKIPKKVLLIGTKLEVEVIRHQDGRLLVKKVVSINGELYDDSKNTTKGKKTKPSPFPGLDQRYVLNQLSQKTSKKGKKISVVRQKTRISKSYGLKLFNEDFLQNWQESSYIKISNYSEVHDIIPDHPESKFVGEIISFNLIEGWQGFIYCKSINSLVYVRHNNSRISGSLQKGAVVEFFIGTNLDNRGDIQFVARNWESSVNRGGAPEPAISIEFEDFKNSKPFVESLLSDLDQFLLITSSRVTSETVYYVHDIEEYLKKEYPNYPFQVLGWPEFSLDNPKSRATSGTGRFSHPLIADHYSAAVVLFPQPKGDEEE